MYASFELCSIEWRRWTEVIAKILLSGYDADGMENVGSFMGRCGRVAEHVSKITFHP